MPQRPLVCNGNYTDFPQGDAKVNALMSAKCFEIRGYQALAAAAVVCVSDRQLTGFSSIFKFQQRLWGLKRL